MNILARYIFKKCLFNTFSLLFAFSMIYSIVQAIQELGSVGKGSYTTLSMFIYLGALLPNYIYLLIPLSVLIGVMTTMLGLVKSSEYAIMRTSGISLLQISKILAYFGILFTIITFITGELIAPKASEFAKLYKLNKTNTQISSTLKSGIWSKDGSHNIINIGEFEPSNPYSIFKVKIFNYSKDQELTQYLTANEAAYDLNNKYWILKEVVIYKYLTNKILIESSNNLIWRSSIDPSYFNVLAVSPDDMPAFSLVKYIKHLKQNHQNSDRQEITLWNKLLYPIACISMAFIACGFIPNNGRNINLSTKLFVGILIGVAFFFINKFIGFIASIYAWNPILSASLPTIILFLIGIIVLIKKEA